MPTNPGFRLCKEERNNQSFFKVLQGADVSSENMRAIPYNFARSVSQNELSGKMKITAVWGSSWDIGISKNPRFYFMEKAGWDKFVRETFLGDDDFITFTHKGNMRFNVNIFKENGLEMIHPPQSTDFLASSIRIKRERDEDVFSDVPPTTAETNGGRKDTIGSSSLGRKKAKESEYSKMTKKSVSVRRDAAGASSSSSVAEFTIFIKKSYLTSLVISKSVTKDHMPKKRTTFKIHHPDMKRSWDVVYFTRPTGISCFSGGWRRLTREYPVYFEDSCKFTFMNPTELLLVVSTPVVEIH